MTATDTALPPAASSALPSRRGRRRVGALIGLAVALAASSALVIGSPPSPKRPTGGRVSLANAWPAVQRADIPSNLSDGPFYTPGMFFDAHASVGTAPTPDGTHLRLVLRNADGSIRELRRVSLAGNPQFGSFAASGDMLVWMESTERNGFRLWAVNLRDGAPARQVTADTGRAVFYGSEYDVVIADGRVHWAANADGKEQATEIRSVELSGGPVEKKTESGEWALGAWPWLLNGVVQQNGTTRLLNVLTQAKVAVPSAPGELSTCSAAWCRVVVMSGQDVVRVDLMHPDGTARRRIAGGATSAAIVDVAPMDRFEVISEATSDSDLTGAARLLVYEIGSGRTVDVSGKAQAAFCRNGVLWWSSGSQDIYVWHTIDLRTV
jgi:hypothetical protein